MAKLATISNIRLIIQIFLFSLFSSFFFFGSHVTPIFIPALQCDHQSTNLVTCLFGPLQRILTAQLPIQGYIPYAILASILIWASLFGRAWCGWACPLGLLQDFIAKIRVRVFRHSFKEPSRWLHENLLFFKYGYFVVLILLSLSIGVSLLYTPSIGRVYYSKIPTIWSSEPICQLCPAPGMFIFWPTLASSVQEGLFLGNTKWVEDILILVGNSPFYLIVTILFVLGSLYIRRAYCRYVCPLAVVLVPFNKVTPFARTKDFDKCTKCETCLRNCPMAISSTSEEEDNPRLVDSECSLCLTCVEKCPEKALKLSIGNKSFGLTSLRED
jgi:polyferredoxin